MRFHALLLPMLLSLQACCTAPTDPALKAISLPELVKLPADALEHNFTEATQRFLSGNLALPISYELNSKPATAPTTTPARP